MVPTTYVLSKNKKNTINFDLKCVIFTAIKKRTILHRHVKRMRFGVFEPQHEKTGLLNF